MFKNARFWRFSRHVEFSSRILAVALRDDVIKPLGPQESSRSGWVPIVDDDFVLDDGYWLFCLQTDEKILPAHVVNRYARERAEQLGRKPRRKEMEEIKDQVRLDLLPRAFVKTTTTLAFINPIGGTVVVDSASARKAEDLLSRLRKTLGSLPVRSPAVQHSPRFTMTGWLSGTVDRPEDFVPGEACEMHGLGESSAGKVKVVGLDLEGEEVQTHINNGKQVVSLEVGFEDLFTAVVKEDLSLKSVKWTAEFRDRLDDENSEFLLRSEFYLGSRTLVRAMQGLIDSFGGEYQGDE